MSFLPRNFGPTRARCCRSLALFGPLLAILALCSPPCSAATHTVQSWALAAEQGDDAALAHLYAGLEAHDAAAERAYASYCLNRGDDAGALRWFGAAARQGDAAAQFQLAELYARGAAGPSDPAQAVLWYRKAAAQGYAAAEFELGMSYLHGDGVAPDAHAAHHWLQAAAAAGDAAAAQALAGLAPIAADAVRPAATSSTAAASHPPVGSAPASATATSPSPAPTPATSATVAAPATATAGPHAVTAAVLAWADAWSHKDFAAYFGAYLPNYAPAGTSHAAWHSARQARIADKAAIAVRVEQLHTQVDGNTARATFIEHFRAGSLHFVGPKTLQLRLVKGRWLIDAES